MNRAFSIFIALRRLKPRIKSIYIRVLVFLFCCIAPYPQDAHASLAEKNTSGPAPDAQKTAALNDWLRKNAIPLRTVEAGSGFEDMQPLKKLIGEARLVSLGEATHGTRDFFQLKHRMLEFLVSEMGFTLFGIEGNMPEAFDINDYVLTGRGDPEKALAGLYFWTWDTQEVLDMIEWMRRYNADPAHTRKVKFYGFDMQYEARAARVVLEYLRKVDPDRAKTSEELLSMPANPWETQYDKLGQISKQKNKNMLTSVNSLLAQFDQQKKNYIRQTSDREWKIACQHVRILSQCIENHIVGSVSGVRDRFMAENIRWILDFEGPDSKMMVWAHNGHVATSKIFGDPSMGAHLRKMFGRDMVVFGFAFNQGGFQAREGGGNFPPGPVHPFTIAPAPQGTLDATLAAAGLSIAAIDLHALPKSGPVAEFFGHPLKTHNIGAIYFDGGSYLSSQESPKLFDALFFIEKTKPARPLPGGLRPLIERLPGPANLDFEKITPDGKLMDWTAERGISGLEFQVSASRDRPHGGNYSALIRRDPGRHYGETFGNLSQYIKVTDYRGKKLRLRAAVRTEDLSPSSQAYLWIKVNGILSGTVYNETPIRSNQWQEYEVSCDAGSRATMISYGLALLGEGKAWIDDVSLDITGNASAVGTQSGLSNQIIIIVCILSGLLLLGILSGVFFIWSVKRRRNRTQSDSDKKNKSEI